MRCCTLAGSVVLVLVLAAPAAAGAQDSLPPWEGGMTSSLGQPLRYGWYAGATLGADWRRPPGADFSILGALGAVHALTNPVTGFLAAALEGYAGVRASEPAIGLRALLQVPILGVSAGVDYSVRDDRASPMVALALPVRRGGIVGRGTLLRAEWLPAADAVRVSVLVPLLQTTPGHTRPLHAEEVTLPTRPAPPLRLPDAPPELWDALANVRASAERLQDLVVPALDVPGADAERALAPLIARLRARPSLPGVDSGPGLGVDRVVRAFHAELARAFAIAASGERLALGQRTPAGDTLEARARGVLLEHVLFPFDRLLGQRKPAGTLHAFGAYARGNFARLLVTERLAPDARSEAVLFVFQELLAAVESVERMARGDWDDSRELWLPLQLGLLPEEHDTQAELDALVERAVGQRFTDGNRVWYVINDRQQDEVERSIRDARDYHVLWIHDFRGLTEEGKPDRRSLRYVVRAYLEALTARVRAYDDDPRHRLPIYLIFLDQHYYEVNAGRVWLDLLEHPLRPMSPLPPGSDSIVQAVDSAQRALRDAVAHSRLLEAERLQYGETWLDNLVRVQINVTNPADPSFRARGIIPLLGIPDNLIRDHRKIVFYDLSAEDPYRGLALYTGIGIGEHYAGPTWEDRAIVVQGPALWSLREQAQRLLLSQGLRPDQVPFPLRARPKGPDYDRLVAAEVARQQAWGVGGQRAMELHNLTGYEDKAIDVAKATLYTLMPPGSVLKIPDSLWNSTLYAALLAGSAFRGCRVLVMAPSLRSAPSAGWPQMALAHDLLARLIVLQRALAPELDAGGGFLKTGIYNPGTGVQDVVGRFVAAYRNARSTPFLIRLLPLDPSVDSLIVDLTRQRDLLLAAGPGQGQPSPDSVVPKLHLKANFFATREGWDSLAMRPQVLRAVEAYIGQLLRGDADARGAAQALSEASQRLVDGFLEGRPPAVRERAAYYLIVGSANQDYRSMFLDGEASVLLSGRAAVVGLVDFALLASLSVWVDDLRALDALLPPPSGFQRVVARWLRPLL
jgi:hypothetical protein